MVRRGPDRSAARADAIRRVLLPLLIACAWGIGRSPLLGNDLSAGSELYRKECATCHGQHGEGTKEHFARPLSGDRSPAQLARFISRSMPPDEPGTVSGKDAELIAAHIYDAFYSRDAQARRQAPRIEFSHLTARQYVHAIADLMVSFYGTPPRDDRHGLEGQYAAINANGDGKHVLTRIDPEVRFDFGKSSPDPAQIEPAEFAISWTGSIRAPESGDYEFIVRSPNSVALYVNDRKLPVIDAWVKSGEQSEFRRVVRLIGGRSYPLRLNFTKAGQGGRKPEALRSLISPASVSLEWKPPGRSIESIPARRLTPLELRETLVVETPFPADDRSTGIERGTAVSAEWEQATTFAGLEAAAYVRAHLGDLCGVVEPDKSHEPKLIDFCARFAERAFRRPLTAEQRELYVDRRFAEAPDQATALERSILMILKSPRFLYLDVGGPVADNYNVASRLSFALWDSLPDNELLSAAAAGKLTRREQVVAQARRMTADPRFDAKLREFFIQWMKIDQARELKKDPATFPEFNADVAADLRTSLELLLEEVLSADPADFRRLLLADYLYLNGRLAKVYGADLPADAPFQKVHLNSNESAGVLTHPYLMSTFADATTSSPIRRGVFVVRSMLGRTLRPPPDAVTPLAPALHPDLTTRERTTLQTSAATCQSCHGLINPLGFALERFDALGRVRGIDNRRAIDATGSYESRRGDTVNFNGARELGGFLAGSDEVHTALVEKLFYYTVKQPVRAFGSNALSQLLTEFIHNEFNVRRLMADIAAVYALSDERLPESRTQAAEE